jgi:hypothetical protein
VQAPCQSCGNARGHGFAGHVQLGDNLRVVHGCVAQQDINQVGLAWS